MLLFCFAFPEVARKATLIRGREPQGRWVYDKPAWADKSNPVIHECLCISPHGDESRPKTQQRLPAQRATSPASRLTGYCAEPSPRRFRMCRSAFAGLPGELAWLSKHGRDITCLLTCQSCFAAPFHLRVWNFPCSSHLPAPPLAPGHPLPTFGVIQYCIGVIKYCPSSVP